MAPKGSKAGYLAVEGLIVTADGLETSPSSSPPDRRQVDAARDFLRARSSLSTYFARSRTSYGIKREAERWLSAQGRPTYISNGALIMAAMEEGIAVKPAKGSRLNAYLKAKIVRSPR